MKSSDDYRSSHLERGRTYDSNLATVPFDAYMAHWERHYLKDVVRELFSDSIPRYLDFACGTGRALTTVAPFATESVGVDVSASMLEVARAKIPGAAFHCVDLTTMDPDLGVFDLITSFRFFGNAQDELREGVLRALVRRLTPNGFLVINSHRNPRALSAILDRMTGGDAGTMDLHLPKLRALLMRHGLRIRRLQPIGAWLFRSRMLEQCRADDPVAALRERQFRHPVFSSIAPDLLVVAQRV